MKVNELMADSVEIERKWLIDPARIPYDLTNAEVFDIEQTYINFSPEISLLEATKEQTQSSPTSPFCIKTPSLQTLT